NDDRHELEMLAEFLVEFLGPETPWHISGFYPTYKLLDRPSTPLETLIMAREIGIKTGLKYVYTGNVLSENSENTFCYKCNNLLIDRQGFYVKKNLIENGRCAHCGAHIDGIGL
ncbi:MAG: radical SAM protein, partial [Desulfobacterales bacterium]|nr:radical SAM protein [Desulfobacterales bacterium]